MKKFYIYLTNDGNSVLNDDFVITNSLDDDVLEDAYNKLQERLDFDKLDFEDYPIGILHFNEAQ